MTTRPPVRLETLIPALLAVLLACDLAARSFPLEILAFRADEALGQFPPFGGPGNFEPNRHFATPRSFGDLAGMGNLPELRVYREQTFTTDSLGFRNKPRPGEGPPTILMVGTSFTVGGNVRDEENLPSRIEALNGCRVANAGGVEYVARTIKKLPEQFGMTRGLVILECLERYVGRPDLLADNARMTWLPRRDLLVASYRAASHRWNVSPLRVLCQRTYKSLSNDRILPNIHKDSVALRELVDGERMLFLRALEGPKATWGVAGHVDWITTLRDDLKASGFDLAVLIVPDKLTIYGPLLREPGPDRQAGAAFLEDFAGKLRAVGIPVANPTPVLVEEARKAIEKRSTIYWLDDTHWDPKGIDIAARAVSEALDLRARCRGESAQSKGQAGGTVE